ncbi:MAG TPA: hypothetical protein VLG69_03325 [Candidatus Andersenbacteria bacterium]|nr:hypothetical protein [Candidatus Andersenbacteria bacterium]
MTLAIIAFFLEGYEKKRYTKKSTSGLSAYPSNRLTCPMCSRLNTNGFVIAIIPHVVAMIVRIRNGMVEHRRNAIRVEVDIPTRMSVQKMINFCTNPISIPNSGVKLQSKKNKYPG